MSEVLKHALVEDRGEYFIDYSKVLLSKGAAKAPGEILIDCQSSGEISLNYEPPKNSGIIKELIVALYNPLADLWEVIKEPWPGKGRFCFKPVAFNVLEAYVFLRSADGSDASQSQYMGSLSFRG